MSLATSKFEYINEDAISDELKCIICSQPFQSPVIIDCKHIFCLSCITTWSRLNVSCPVCRHSFATPGRFARVTSDTLLSQLNILLVRCLQCDNTEMKRVEFEAHLERCSKKRISRVSKLFGKPWHSIKTTMRPRNQRRVPMVTTEGSIITNRELRYPVPRANQMQIPEPRSSTWNANSLQGSSGLRIGITSVVVAIIEPLILLFIKFMMLVIPLVCIVICVAFVLIVYLGIFWRVLMLFLVISCCLMFQRRNRLDVSHSL